MNDDRLGTLRGRNACFKTRPRQPLSSLSNAELLSIAENLPPWNGETEKLLNLVRDGPRLNFVLSNLL